MRVLITGTSGFVGSHILEDVLCETDWEIVCVNSFRHNGGMEKFIAACGDRADIPGRVLLMTHDLRSPFSEWERRQIGEIDFIINAASLCQVDASIRYPADFISNNVQLQLNTLELARVLNPRQLVHLSTDEVYGPDRACGVTDHKPSSPYAASKAAQEDISRSYALTYGIPTTIVNSANMFGERQSQLAFIPKIVNWIQTGQIVPIHYSRELPGGRFYTYVKNVARHIVQLLQSISDETLDLCLMSRESLAGQQFVPNDLLVLRVARLLDRVAITEIVQGQDVRPGYDACYEPMIASPLWSPEIDVNEGLARTVKWLEDR